MALQSPSAKNTPHLDTLLATLPVRYAGPLRSLLGLQVDTDHDVLPAAALDAALRFVLGEECLDSNALTRTEWTTGQEVFCTKTERLITTMNAKKRGREDDGELVSATHVAKKAKSSAVESTNLNGRVQIDDVDPPLFTLHSVSTTSPLRKKLDITMHSSSVRFVSPPAANAAAAPATPPAIIPLSSLHRAFLIPTPDKPPGKEHWTVILLSSDRSDRKDATSQMQVIFGVEAKSTSSAKKDAFVTTMHPSGSTSASISQSKRDDDSELVEPTVYPKGTETLPHLLTFLSFLPPHITLIANCSTLSSSSSPQIEPVSVLAYRAAKQSCLHFFSSPLPGILWAPNKPCEFFSVQDIMSGTDGVRMMSGTGRLFSVIITRKGKESAAGNDDDEDLGEETEFAMIDAKEMDRVKAWVRTHKGTFGKIPQALSQNGSTSAIAASGSGSPMKGANGAEDESDEEDEDFVDNSSSDGGSATSSSSEFGSGDEGNPRSDGQNGSEEDAMTDDESGEEDGEEEDDMDPAHHPLLRPGAMPRMSRAAIDAVVGMVESDLAGIAKDSDEEDELDD